MDIRTKVLQELIDEQNCYTGLRGECLFCESNGSHKKGCLITKAIEALSHITVHCKKGDYDILIDYEDYERIEFIKKPLQLGYQFKVCYIRDSNRVNGYIIYNPPDYLFFLRN